MAYIGSFFARFGIRCAKTLIRVDVTRVQDRKRGWSGSNVHSDSGFEDARTAALVSSVRAGEHGSGQRVGYGHGDRGIRRNALRHSGRAPGGAAQVRSGVESYGTIHTPAGSLAMGRLDSGMD